MSLMSPYLSNTLCISSLVTHNGNHNTLHRRISLSHAYMCSVTFRFGGLKLLPFQLSTTVESLKVINHWSPRSIRQAASTPSSLTKSTIASTPSSLTKSVPVHRCQIREVVLVAFSHVENHPPYTSDDLIFCHMVQRFNISPRFQHSGEIIIRNSDR